VSIDAIDPNNNYVHLGDAKSDMNGLFDCVWKAPTISGEYKVIANFAGSESYYPSHAETAMFVQDGSATPTSQPIQSAPDNTLTIIGSTIAVLIAIGIVGIVLFLTLRKRP